MSGECKSYRLNDPMTWGEFTSMPDDIKVTYIKLLRHKFNVPDCKIAEMLGVHRVTLSRYLKTLGCSAGSHSHTRETAWNADSWLMWVQGEPTQEEINEPFMEEDVSFPCQEEPDHIDPVHRMCIPVQSYGGARAIPNSGSMTFEGDIGEMLEAVAVLLGGHLQRFVFPGKYAREVLTMTRIEEKAMAFITGITDVYRDEENRELEAFGKMEFSEDATEDFTAMLVALKCIYAKLTGDHDTDIIDFTHILNKLAVQHIMGGADNGE